MDRILDSGCWMLVVISTERSEWRDLVTEINDNHPQPDASASLSTTLRSKGEFSMTKESPLG